MNISFVLPGLPWRPVGGFRVVYEYANRLAARGHIVSVYHARRTPNWNAAGRSDWHQAIRATVGRLRDMIFQPEVRWQAIDPHVRMFFISTPASRHIQDADIVFATSWATAEYVAEYPPHKGRKFYLVQDFYPYLGPQERIEATWRLPLKKVAVSSWLKEQVRNSEPRLECSHVANGIDVQRFRCVEPLESRPARIAMLYSSAPYKAPGDGIAALEAAKKAHPEIQAVCFGPRRRPAQIPHWIEYRTKLSDDALVSLYNSTRIFLSSSLAEGFALPGAEAMACGCTVVTTDSGGNRDYSEHEVTALVSPPAHPEALAGNLTRVLSDDSLRLRLARSGLESVKRFSWDQSTDQLEALLKRP